MSLRIKENALFNENDVLVLLDELNGIDKNIIVFGKLDRPSAYRSQVTFDLADIGKCRQYQIKMFDPIGPPFQYFFPFRCFYE